MADTMRERIADAIMRRSLVWDGYDPDEAGFEQIVQTNWYTNGEIYLDYADAALDARDAEIKRLRGALGGLHDALGLRRDDHELLRDYGELGLDWIKRARTALNGGDH